MIPTEQDKELREKLKRAVLETGRYDTIGDEQLEDKYLRRFIDELMQLITADRKRVALEARINEANRSKQAVMLYRYPARKLAERIAELKAQQEEV